MNEILMSHCEVAGHSGPMRWAPGQSKVYTIKHLNKGHFGVLQIQLLCPLRRGCPLLGGSNVLKGTNYFLDFEKCAL